MDTPFFSPDGRWIGFHSAAENKIKKIAITGGASVTICDSQLPYGASWTTDGHILLGAGPAGILRVSENGGKPETVISVKDGEFAHGPQLLPGGNTILFTLANGTSPDRWDKAQIVVQSLRSSERKAIWEGGSDGRYVPSGHVVYASGPTLLAIPFDIQNLTRTGGPVPVIEGVFRTPNSAVTTGAAHYGLSENGSMVYVPGSNSEGNNGRVLALVDPSGTRKPIAVPPAPYLQPRVSPNGKQLVVGTDDGKDAVVWVYDLAGTTSMRRLTFGGANRFPLWSRDGQRVVFASDREGDIALFWQRADGNGSAERLTKPELKQLGGYTPDSWSLDGKTLLFSSVGGTDTGIWSVVTERDAKPKLLIDTPSKRDDFSSVSPDGHWIAYESNEGGPTEIYVQPFPPTSAKYQITTTGGAFPVWAPDGKRIFFIQGRTGIGRIFSIDVQMQPSFVFGKPTPLAIDGILGNGGAGMPRGYDITPDGKFVVMLSFSEAETSTRQINRST